ncbi:MAG: hypothetical protein ACE5LQ_04570 [Candidatus Bipolaricaulia bacterium]
MIEQELTELAQEITGKERPEEALSTVLKAYLEQQIERYQKVIHGLEQKHGMSFEEFEKELGLKLPLSWEHEKDYMAWEEAITNLQYFQRIAERLKAYA